MHTHLGQKKRKGHCFIFTNKEKKYLNLLIYFKEMLGQSDPDLKN